MLAPTLQCGGQFAARLLDPTQIDWESSVGELANIVLRPKRILRSVELRQTTRGAKHRDDPGVLLLILGICCGTSTAWAVALGAPLRRLPLVLLCHVAVHLALAAGVAALCCRLARLRLSSDWAYCLDVHFNGSLPLCLWAAALPLALLPLLTAMPRRLAVAVLNALAAAGCAHYCCVASLGFTQIIGLSRAAIFLYPSAVLGLVALLGVLMNRAVLQDAWANAIIYPFLQ